MKKFLLLLSFPMLFLACNNEEPDKKQWDYPETPKGDVVDDYFGVEVPDPYRWLENDTSKETTEWVKKQNEVTLSYLESIDFRDDLKERLEKIWDYPKISAPYHKNGYYFYYKNDGLQDHSVLYKTDKLGEEGEVCIDPNTFSEDGSVSLASVAVSDDGKYLAYGTSNSGSDWNEYSVKNIETGKKLDDHIKWIKFSGVSWYKDGFYYSRYPEPKKADKFSGKNSNNKVYYHKLGDKQSEDFLVYEDTENPGWNYSVGTTDDNKYLILSVSESTSGNALYVKNLKSNQKDFTKIIENFDSEYWVVSHNDSKLFVMTNYEAPKYKLIAIDPENPDKENWETVIPEKDFVLKSVSHFDGKLIAKYMKDAHSVVKVFNEKGEFLNDVDIPELGTVRGFRGEKEDSITFYTVTSFTTPSTVYKYYIDENKSELYRESQIDFNPGNYKTKQVFFESKDGTDVPMFIVHKKGIELDGENPTLIYGYGGFNISLTPYFSINRLLWLEQGGVFVMVNLRGGGEYGEEWHKAGIKMNKKNVFNDFIAATEYLHENKYTNPDKTAILGGSNGGLLIGAVINMRPDLYEVAIPIVGVMDMLRYHLFTIGKFWASDYGTSADSKEMFEYLYSYSPLHNISEDKEYPAVFVKTADHDDRVVPAHSFKYIATLQKKYDGENPVMIRIETKSGHGAGKPTDMVIQNYADVYAFIFENMDIEPKY